MFRNRIVCLLLALVLTGSLAGAVWAAEVDSDATYCFSSADFSDDEALTGVCITALPEAAVGTVLLGSRVVQPGDILTAEQLALMTFAPLRTQEDVTASVSYLPIYPDHVAQTATMTIAVRGKEDKAPIAEDMVMETYKNLPNEAQLKVMDPEGGAMTYTVVRQPKRGEVILRQDGSFLYTPKKNKVGVDSFTYTATDAAGNVSREATVTIQIIKPTDAAQYTDTIGRDCRFAAEWMRNTGLFVGEKISGEQCFYPDKEVSRGEFLAMVVKVLNIPREAGDISAMSADAPQWMQPYLAAAVRAGLTTGIPVDESGAFDAEASVTGAEAAVMLQNALDLTAIRETGVTEEAAVPAWAADALNVLEGYGICLTAGEAVTRGQAANALYRVSALAEEAPGTAVFRVQQ